MENQENHRPPFSMLGVSRETINTIVRNRRLMKLIICLLILTNIQFQVATRYDLEPHQQIFSIQISTERSSNMRNDVMREVHEQLMTKVHMLICSCCLYLYLAIITISSSYESYTGNTLSIMNAFFKVSRNWKRPLLTTGYILLMTLGIYVAYGFVFSNVAISFVAVRPRADSFSAFYISALKWICSTHMASLWMMSLVVSVLEKDISGLKAISRAGDLMIGRRIQAYLLIIFYYVAYLFVGKTFEATFMMLLERGFEERAIWATMIPFVTGFTSVLQVFVFVFYTVFYHECKTKHKEDGILHDHSVADSTS